jgi:DNA-binding response OmpR family regulator
MVSEALNMLGYETRVAHDGTSGIAAEAEFQPAVAMLDIGLPADRDDRVATILGGLGP